MNRIVQNQNGATLIVTLAIVAVLFTAGLQLKHYVQRSANETRLGRNLFQAEEIAMSGFELAKVILADDASRNRIDSVQESWADPETLSDAVAALELGDDVLTLEIEDELSKIQLNALIIEYPGNVFNNDQARLWEKMSDIEPFSRLVVDSTDPTRMVNPLKDWLDSGDDDLVTGLSGAESDYYQGLDPPYESANGPIDYLGQLEWVKGFSFEHEQEASSDPEESEGEDVQWDRLLTIYGLADKIYGYPGKVNINTAPIEVIRALLPEGLQEMAQDLVDYRSQKSENQEMFINTLDRGWVKTVVELGPDEKQKFDNLTTYSSDYFKVICQVRYHEVNRTWVAYMKREKDNISGKWACRVLQMRVL